MTPAETLKALRLRAGLTQAQLAEKAGLDRSWVNQMERGNRTIGSSPAAKLADVLGVSPAEFGVEDERLPEYRSLSGRLAELEAEFALERQRRERALRAVIRRLAEIEAALETQGHTEGRQRRGRPRR